MTDLTDLTVDWLSALLDSADTDTIGVAHWWDRATSALETAAAGADNAAQAVTIAARKLQIDTLGESSATTMARITPEIDGRFAEWVEKVAAESVYIVALCRVQRTARRKPKPTPAVSDALPNF